MSILACSSLPVLKFGPSESADSQTPAEIPYCDANPAVLCIVSFGANSQNRMVINFYKPDLSVPDFYVTVRHRETASVYECRTVEDIPTNIYCGGERIPLEDTIDIEVYSINDDTLIAKGTFVITAYALATAPIVTVIATNLTTSPVVTPSHPSQTTTSTPVITRTNTPKVTSTPFTKTPTRTPTTNSYPNP